MIRIYENPPFEQWKEIYKRAQIGDDDIAEKVKEILNLIKTGGDKAIRELTLAIDGVDLACILVGKDEFDKAQEMVPENLKEAIETAKNNIEKFHSAQLHTPIEMETTQGVKCIQRAVPIRKVGLYIPGGTAPLFSTVLMLAVPAKIAGCKEIILATPPDKKGGVAPEILYAAKLCGVDKVFKVGGAMAIAAMAYSTENIPKVDKIFGPGNRYVTKAKQLVSLFDVAIDMPAGPSEVMIIADSSANSKFVACDMLSQAEHGADSQAIVVTDSLDMAKNIAKEVEEELQKLSRRDVASKALSNSSIVVLDKREDMISFANEYAAEHLIISMYDAEKAALEIECAGSIFIGNYTPESAGDYASGTNHTLPTNGWAVSYSGVNLDSFQKKITYQTINAKGLLNIGPTIEVMADAEGLTAHKRAVSVRLEDISKTEKR